MNVLHIDKNHPLLMQQLSELGCHNETDFTSSKEAVMDKIAAYEGIVIRSRFKIDKQFIDKAINLKFIARVGAGLESIDVAYAVSKGIHLIAAPEGNRNAVGEHALGMLLCLFNKLHQADQSIKGGSWLREAHRGIELEGQTVGIIGYGNMGKAFAKKLQGFDCTVLCYDIKPGVGDAHAVQVSLTEFQKQVTVLSLHTPWTPETNQLINSSFIHQFKNDFWFINTARGKSVVTHDLVDALKSGKVLGAGLDVLEYEKLSFESLFSDALPEVFQYLIDAPNVLLSPHVAGWTVESKRKLAQTIVDKIKAIL